MLCRSGRPQPCCVTPTVSGMLRLRCVPPPPALQCGGCNLECNTCYTSASGVTVLVLTRSAPRLHLTPRKQAALFPTFFFPAWHPRSLGILIPSARDVKAFKSLSRRAKSSCLSHVAPVIYFSEPAIHEVVGEKRRSGGGCAEAQGS